MPVCRKQKSLQVFETTLLLEMNSSMWVQRDRGVKLKQIKKPTVSQLNTPLLGQNSATVLVTQHSTHAPDSPLPELHHPIPAPSAKCTGWLWPRTPWHLEVNLNTFLIIEKQQRQTNKPASCDWFYGPFSSFSCLNNKARQLNGSNPDPCFYFSDTSTACTWFNWLHLKGCVLFFFLILEQKEVTAWRS